MLWFHRSDTIRSRVTLDEIEGLRITIPAFKNWFIRTFLPLWLVGWAIGELTVVAALVGFLLGHPIRMNVKNAPAMPFLALWLAGWTVAGLFALDAFLWMLRGQEVIAIDPDGTNLVVRRLGTLFPRRVRSYPVERVRNLRYGPLTMPLFPTSFRESYEFQLQWLGTGGGSVAFDNDGGSDRFGSHLSETESRRLIKTIKDHYKILDDADESLPVERL